MVTSVLFDMGGTLETLYNTPESKELEIRRILEILRAHGIDLPGGAEALEPRVRAGLRRYAQDRDVNNEEQKPDRIWCDYVLADYNIPRSHLAPLGEELADMWENTHYIRSMRPEVPAMLEELTQMGLKLSMISNTTSLYQVFDQLERYGIRRYFRDVTLSSITGYHKPGTEIFRVALRQICSRPEECVYVGDTVSRDVIGARDASFAASIQIHSFLTEPSDVHVPAGIAPDYFIASMSEIPGILRSLREKG
jgi:putative hydrolase of the HAD superfamily